MDTLSISLMNMFVIIEKTLKTLFNIVEAPFNFFFNFDVCVV